MRNCIIIHYILRILTILEIIPLKLCLKQWIWVLSRLKLI